MTTTNQCCEHPRKFVSISTKWGRRVICNSCGAPWTQKPPQSDGQVDGQVSGQVVPSEKLIPSAAVHDSSIPPSSDEWRIADFIAEAEYLGSPSAEALSDNGRLNKLIRLAQRLPNFLHQATEAARSNKYVEGYRDGSALGREEEYNRGHKIGKAAGYIIGVTDGRTQRNTEILEMIERLKKRGIF